jgi:hypothetical protein
MRVVGTNDLGVSFNRGPLPEGAGDDGAAPIRTEMRELARAAGCNQTNALVASTGYDNGRSYATPNLAQISTIACQGGVPRRCAVQMRHSSHRAIRKAVSRQIPIAFVKLAPHRAGRGRGIGPRTEHVGAAAKPTVFLTLEIWKG